MKDVTAAKSVHHGGTPTLGWIGKVQRQPLLPRLLRTWHNKASMDRAIAEGIHLFNTRNFFAAHEALEAVWLQARGEEKVLLHGLIQVAAAFHHHQRGNIKGFKRVLEKGAGKLEGLHAARDINVGDFLAQLAPWRVILRRAASLEAFERLPLPRIRPTRNQ